MQEILSEINKKNRICILLCILLILTGVYLSECAAQGMYLKQQEKSCITEIISRTLPVCSQTKTEEGIFDFSSQFESDNENKPGDMCTKIRILSSGVAISFLMVNLWKALVKQRCFRRSSICFEYVVIRYIHQKDGRKRLAA